MEFDIITLRSFALPRIPSNDDDDDDYCRAPCLRVPPCVPTSFGACSDGRVDNHEDDKYIASTTNATMPPHPERSSEASSLRRTCDSVISHNGIAATYLYTFRWT